jgi:two-component system, NtrC family, response regulator HydG
MTRRVLVVDDDRHMVKTISAILDRQGWASTGAFSGEEAVAVAVGAEPRFRAVLMDVRMPGMNGVEATQAIRAAHPCTPVILMTAYAAQDVLAEARASGVVTIMPKPLAWPKLIAHLASIPHGPCPQ